MTVMRSWLREPLLHFLLIGAALFALYRTVGSQGNAPQEIIVSEAQVEALATNFARTWMRPPTAGEIRGLVDDYIKEEIYYREALALGLDRDDTVIRRRLRQKMEFVSDDSAAAREPTDAELAQFLHAYADRFADPPSLSFRQEVYSSERRGESATADARRALARVNAAPASRAAEPSGDPSLLPPQMTDVTSRDVANVFGEAFAAELEGGALDRWIGPVESPFGAHLVRISSRTAGRLPPLAEIRPAVIREWQAAQRRATDDARYEALRSKYDVRVEGDIGELLRRQADRADPAASKSGRS